MDMKSYLLNVPKAELHVHLEGSIQPATLLTLAQRNKVELPAHNVAEFQNWFKYRDFNHFIEIYVAITRCLRTVEDYELIAYEFGANMARQHVRYAEITFSPGTHYSLKVPQDAFLSGLKRGRERARAEFGVEMRWVFDIVRGIEDPDRSRRLADYTTSLALEYRDEGVVALGLGGAEAGYPPEPFASWFERARAAGLHSAPHGGETAGPESIWGAIRALGAERIGHGVRAIEDPELVAYLVEHQIPIELCPTSNICLGVYPNLAAHPLPQLYAAGIPLTINSDDPPLFNTSMNQEVALLADPFHLETKDINTILLNGVRHSFMSEQEKQAMEQQFLQEMRSE